MAEESLKAEEARFRVGYVPLHVEPGHTVGVLGDPKVDPATSKLFALDYNNIFVDPATGAVVGKRMWGACCLERENLIPFLYQLHYRLHLALGAAHLPTAALFVGPDCQRSRVFSRWRRSCRLSRIRLDWKAVLG